MEGGAEYEEESEEMQALMEQYEREAEGDGSMITEEQALQRKDRELIARGGRIGMSNENKRGGTDE